MGGCGFPFMGGSGYGGGYGMEWIVMLLFFGLFGWGGGGFGYGGGAGVLGATSLAATDTAALINQQNTADRVAAANAKADAIAGIATANGTKLETVKDAVTNGFFANQTNLCELGNNISQQFNSAAMQGMQNYNGLTSQITDMRFANQQCCCDTRQLIQSSFCDLRHQMQLDKCDTDAKIVAQGEMTRALLRDMQTQKLQEELAAAKAQLSQDAQTNKLAALIAGRGCCNPCGTYNGGCNPCADGIQRAVNNALGERIGEILFPTTATTSAG